VAIRLNGASDTCWASVNDRAETIHTIAASLVEQNGRHYVVRQMCGHIANHAQAIIDLNRQHLRGYDPAHDDNIGVMCDRIGLLLRDEALVRALPDAYVAIMRAGVSAIRSALFARQGQERRETDAARFEPRKVMAA
jgi:hypothetical protein